MHGAEENLVNPGDPAVRLLGMAFMAPVAGYVLITPGYPPAKGTVKILRALGTVLVSVAILVVATGSDWHVARSWIKAQFSAFSRRKVEGELAIRIGLGSATVQLQGSVPEMPLTKVDYNEKFQWSYAEDMKRHYQDALERGLPFPVLTAAEYLSVDTEGFRWGRHYLQAGHYAYFCLWSAFALWLLSNILWSVHKMYSAVCLLLTGQLLLITNLVYSFNLAKRPLIIPCEGQVLEFSYGWCYYLTMGVGVACQLTGVLLVIIYHLRSTKNLQMSSDESRSIESESYEKPWRRELHRYRKLCNDPSTDLCWTRQVK